jgi:iron(III) transport system permease protein
MTAARHAFPASVSLVGVTVAGLVFLPLAYITGLALSIQPAVWSRLWHTRIPELLWNTATLAAGVALGTLLLGVSLAWMVVRLEFPGRRFWEWALVLPLAMPTYVLAYVYTYLLGTAGPVDQIWQGLAGPQSHVVSPQSYGGAVLVMTLDTFPLVYLLARAALLNLNVSFEEVARVCGLTRVAILFRVTLPLLRPALVAGLSLVILYVISDFGAVSLLRYQTFTYAVYQQMTGRYDHSAAAVLSLLLVVFALIFLLAERWFRQRSRFYQTTGRYRAASRKPCGLPGSVAVTLILWAIFGCAFLVPALLLLKWTMSTIAQGSMDARFWRFVWNSAMLSGIAASAAILLGTPLAYLATRRSARLNMLCLQAAYAGYVLPGPVGALAILLLFSQFAPFLYGTVVILIVAYVVHFLPAGLQTMEPALHQVTPTLEEAARSLGATALETIRRITLPLVQGGFVAAWVLIFLQCMKELPATLLLRPVGFDTLAVRVWLEASEEYFQLAAPPAFLIVLLSLPALMLLVARDWRSA